MSIKPLFGRKAFAAVAIVAVLAVIIGLAFAAKYALAYYEVNALQIAPFLVFGLLIVSILNANQDLKMKIWWSRAPLRERERQLNES